MEIWIILCKHKKFYILQWWHVEGITKMMNSLKKGDISSGKRNVLILKLHSNYLESLLARTG